MKRAKKVIADDFISLFANRSLENIEKLDLSECVQINDEVIKTIALGCPMLECLMLNWCWDVRDQGMEFLIRYCNSIKKLNLLGKWKISWILALKFPVLETKTLILLTFYTL